MALQGPLAGQAGNRRSARHDLLGARQQGNHFQVAAGAPKRESVAASGKGYSRDLTGAHALIIDDKATTRMLLAHQVREFGIQNVKQATRISEARELLEKHRFDLVICDFDSPVMSEAAWDFLDELRRERILPYATVFVMVTGDSSYQRVAEAAEAALDSYLLKPFATNALCDRIHEARRRKYELKDIFEAMEGGDSERAAALCLQRFERRDLYWLYAARIGAELLLDLKRADEARQLYETIIGAKAVPWARLGVARSQIAVSDLGMARRTLESLISDVPAFSDSYDVMGKVQMEQGQLAEALATYRTASTITPGCILRLQHCGTLSFYAGEMTMAAEMLERTWTLGQRSRLFDVLSMMLLTFIRFDAGDGKALHGCCEVLRRFSEAYAQSIRLRRMLDIGVALKALHDRRTAVGVLKARELAEGITRDDVDMEHGANLLSLWSRLDQYGCEPEEIQQVVTTVARRFAVTRATTEVLASAVRRIEAAAGWVRQGHAEIMAIAEKAMTYAMQGHPRYAVELLLKEGAATGNAKLIEMAASVARRHEDRIEDGAELLAAAGELAQRFCVPATHIAGVRRSHRSAGGMVLKR